MIEYNGKGQERPFSVVMVKTFPKMNNVKFIWMIWIEDREIFSLPLLLKKKHQDNFAKSRSKKSCASPKLIDLHLRTIVFFNILFKIGHNS